jgi:hypothetical protein
MILDSAEIIQFKISEYYQHCSDRCRGDNDYNLMGEAISCSIGIIRTLPRGNAENYLLLTSDKIINNSPIIDGNSLINERLYDDNHTKLINLLGSDETGTVRQCLDLCLTKFKEDVRKHQSKKRTSWQETVSSTRKIARIDRENQSFIETLEGKINESGVVQTLNDDLLESKIAQPHHRSTEPTKGILKNTIQPNPTPLSPTAQDIQRRSSSLSTVSSEGSDESCSPSPQKGGRS